MRLWLVRRQPEPVPQSEGAERCSGDLVDVEQPDETPSSGRHGVEIAALRGAPGLVAAPVAVLRAGVAPPLGRRARGEVRRRPLVDVVPRLEEHA